MTFEELLQFAKESEASDIHVTAGTNLAARINGKLQILEPMPEREEAERMILAHLNEEQQAEVKSGKDLDYAIMLPDGTRLRANVYHQRNNLAATYRLLRTEIPTFEELGIPEPIRKLINEPRGLILFTGPTGSGKTTTMASMINYVNKNEAKHVLTIEDPIEYIYKHAKSMIHQREIGKDVDSYASALHSALREDPDIILLGEMRDYETISAAITAAETGHLVLSTLHTSSTAQTIDRIIDTYPAHAQNQVRSQLAQVLKGVVTQLLVPMDFEDGMVMATEVLLNNEAVANLIRENKIPQINSTISTSGNLGMHTMNADLKRLVKEQKITDETARRYATNIRDYESTR